jgi:hypothetical protein
MRRCADPDQIHMQCQRSVAARIHGSINDSARRPELFPIRLMAGMPDGSRSESGQASGRSIGFWLFLTNGEKHLTQLTRVQSSEQLPDV